MIHLESIFAFLFKSPWSPKVILIATKMYQLFMIWQRHFSRDLRRSTTILFLKWCRSRKRNSRLIYKYLKNSNQFSVPLCDLFLPANEHFILDKNLRRPEVQEKLLELENTRIFSFYMAIENLSSLSFRPLVYLFKRK